MFYVWGRPNCVWCHEAKKLLAQHGYEFEYIELAPTTMEEFRQKTNGAKTVPQVFHNDNLVGGHDDLKNYLKYLTI